MSVNTNGIVSPSLLPAALDLINDGQNSVSMDFENGFLADVRVVGSNVTSNFDMRVSAESGAVVRALFQGCVTGRSLRLNANGGSLDVALTNVQIGASNSSDLILRTFPAAGSSLCAVFTNVTIPNPNSDLQIDVANNGNVKIENLPAVMTNVLVTGGGSYQIGPSVMDAAPGSCNVPSFGGA